MKRSLPGSDGGSGKRSRTRKRLTDAALKLMSEQGIVATSVSEIASAADVANGTFYLHFKNKSEIVAAVCQGVTLAMHSEMDSQSLSIRDGAARVLFATQQFIEIAADEPIWGRLLLRAFEEVDTIKDDLSRYMRADVELGIQQGRFRIVLDEFVIDCLLALLRTGLSARLAGAPPDVSLRTGQYMLTLLGLGHAEVEEQLMKATDGAQQRRRESARRTPAGRRPASKVKS